MQDALITTVNRNKTARGYCLVLCVSLLGSFAMGCGPTAPVVEDASEEVYAFYNLLIDESIGLEE